MQFRSSKVVLRVCDFMRHTHFTFASAPPLGALSAGAGVVGGLRELSVNSARVKHGLATSCDVARSVCRPVDDLVGRPTPTYGSSGYGYRSSYSLPGYSSQPYRAPAQQIVVDLNDKGSMLQGLKAAGSTPQEVLDQITLTMADGPGGG